MKKALIIVLILLIVALVGYTLFAPKATSPTETTPGVSPSERAEVIQPSVDISDLQAGGSSYSDTAGVYTILYPSDYQLDTTDSVHPRIYKIGATQKGQTEMYDGVIVVFETINLQRKPLSTWVDEHIQTTTADGTSELISPKKSIVLKTYPGFVYEMRGLGTAKYYVFQKDTSSNYAVVITTSVNDPQNAGFQIEVNKILATLELLK